VVSETNLPASGPNSPQPDLAESANQINQNADHQYRAKSYARASAGSPATVAIVSSAQTKDEYQNNNE
jgi:hypothetical protein